MKGSSSCAEIPAVKTTEGKLIFKINHGSGHCECALHDVGVLPISINLSVRRKDGSLFYDCKSTEVTMYAYVH